MTRGINIGYIRVSTIDQNIDRQLEGLKIDKKFIDYASGKDTNRPNLQLMLEFSREGDNIYVHSMDRLARHLPDLLEIVKEIVNKKVKINFVKENLTFTGEDSPMSHLLLSMLGAIAQFERSLILERQREGIAAAKAKGKFKGGKRKLGPEQIEKLKHLLYNTRESKGKIARELGISPPTFYKYVKEITNALDKSA